MSSGNDGTCTSVCLERNSRGQHFILLRHDNGMIVSVPVTKDGPMDIRHMLHLLYFYGVNPSPAGWCFHDFIGKTSGYMEKKERWDDE